ncbi:MAG: hypothetical protein ACLT8H_03485 [Streptococcus parasanguinis]
MKSQSVADSIQILQGLKETYQDHHHVTITDEAIETAVKYAHRYLTSRQLPDSATDLLDEAAATYTKPRFQRSRKRRVDRLGPGLDGWQVEERQPSS